MTSPASEPARTSTSSLAAAAGPRGIDRRSRRTPRLSRFSFAGGRRRGSRRRGEDAESFVDLYGVRLWLALLWVALMNVADSFFTLIHLQNGGSEVNPVAGALLATGLPWFVLLKSGLIAVALLVLCLHKNFHLARIGLWVAATAYTLLLLYHLSLFGT